MRKVLHYVGHYDYLLYSFLLDSALIDDDVRADFIVQNIRNSNRVNEFIEEKAKGKSALVSNFATLDDGSFLGLDSEEDTLQLVIEKYDYLLEQFGTSIQDYDAIYMSFDEWNSFGIYLEQFERLPPVKVITKYNDHFHQDLYRFIEGPNSFYFSSLQRRYRVLNAESKHITDRISIWGDPDRLKEEYRDFRLALSELCDEKKQRLFDFFKVTCEDLCIDADFLLIADSFWFSNPDNYSYEYSRMYRSFLDLIAQKESRITFKIHPRYELSHIERESILKGARLIEGYVPVELIAACNPKISCACTIGNQIPVIVRESVERFFVAEGSYIFNWRDIDRIDYLFNLANALQYNLEFDDELTRVVETYCRLTGKEVPTFQNENGESGGLVSIFKDLNVDELVDKTTFDSNRKTITCAFDIRNESSVFLNDSEADKILRITLKKYNSDDRYSQSLYFFTDNTSLTGDVSAFRYSARRSFSKSIIRSAVGKTDPYAMGLLADNIYSKEYLNGKARSTTITIIGAGDLAFNFCETWGETLDIRCVVKLDKSDVNPELEKRYEIKNGIGQINRKDYVIICLPFIHNLDILPEYAVSRDNLLRNGFKEFKDFTYYRFFEASNSGKEIMLFCGYCELGGIKQILDLTSANDKYCMVFYHMGRDTNQFAPGFRDFIGTVKFCDILIYAPYVINRETIPVDILKLIKNDTRVVTIPQISFRGYAPYKAVRFNERNIELKLFGIVRYPFLYKIPFVNQMINKGMSNDEILLELKKEDLFTEEEIINNFKEALQILKKMDSCSDVPIYDFIEKSCKEELVFKDCVHANDLIFFEYARRISDYFHENWRDEINTLEGKCRDKGAYFQVATEEPILPCVAKALNLSFDTDKKLYMEKVTDEKIRFKTFDEWFMDYCDYYRAVRLVRKTLSPIYRTNQVTIFRNEMIFGEKND